MKVSSLELFNLIKSLSIQEKVQFKLYARRKRANTNYVTLFGAIDKQKIYNEAFIKEKFKNESFAQRLDNTKSLLIEAIFKSLQEYYSSDWTGAILRNCIHQIEISISKRLFDSAKRIIAKAEKLAEKNDEYYYLSVILSLKRQLIVRKENIEEMNNYPRGDYLKEQECAAIIKNMVDYNKPYMQVVNTITTQAQGISAQQQIALKTLLKNPLLRDEANALSSPAKLVRYHILGRVYRLLKDWKNCYLNTKEVVRLMENNTDYLKGNIDIYIQRMGHLLLSMTMLKKDEELIFFYNKIKCFVESLPKKLRFGSIMQEYITIQNNFIYYLLESFDFHLALKVSEELKASIKKHGSAQNLLVFHGNLFFIHFYLKNYHEALQELNLILNKKATGTRQDIINSFKILNIIIHYELEHEEQLPYLCRATQRYFEKKGALPPALKLILQFFSTTILKTNNEKEKQEAFSILKKELAPLMPEKLFIDFDFISWLESKISGKPFAEVLKECRIKN